MSPQSHIKREDPPLRYHPYQQSARNTRKKILQSLEDNELPQLLEELRRKRNIVVISGAGISTNAGVSDFHSSSRTKTSSRRMYHSSAYCLPETANELHENERKLFESAAVCDSTPFELFMERLSQTGRLRRHYTQNIDCRTDRLPSLSQKTIKLHGELNSMRCHIYSQHKITVTPESFQQLLHSACPKCQEMKVKKENENKRTHSVGFLRPDVALYGEYNPAEPEILHAFDEDGRRAIDAVIIVGTRLQIPSLKRETERLCQKAKAGGNSSLIVWVNKERSCLGKNLKSLVDVEFLMDCDRFASLLSA